MLYETLINVHYFTIIGIAGVRDVVIIKTGNNNLPLYTKNRKCLHSMTCKPANHLRIFERNNNLLQSGILMLPLPCNYIK